jgi:hypothetical protein
LKCSKKAGEWHPTNCLHHQRGHHRLGRFLTAAERLRRREL